MKRKLLWLMVGLLVGSGIAAANLVQAGGSDKGTRPSSRRRRRIPKRARRLKSRMPTRLGTMTDPETSRTKS
jgi:hypothetical protein